jgi:hypothetical protein
MATQHEPKPKFPLLSAFELEGEVEDGLTDSHRPVLRQGRRVPLVGLEPVTDPLAVPAWAPPEATLHPTVRRAEWGLALVGRFVGTRIANEEIGDALERMGRVARAGAPKWVLYAMAGVSTYWVLVHAVRERLGKWWR